MIASFALTSGDCSLPVSRAPVSPCSTFFSQLLSLGSCKALCSYVHMLIDDSNQLERHIRSAHWLWVSLSLSLFNILSFFSFSFVFLSFFLSSRSRHIYIYMLSRQLGDHVFAFEQVNGWDAFAHRKTEIFRVTPFPPPRFECIFQNCQKRRRRSGTHRKLITDPVSGLFFSSRNAVHCARVARSPS